jgi:polysaccharide biosynthesis protein PslG
VLILIAVLGIVAALAGSAPAASAGARHNARTRHHRRYCPVGKAKRRRHRPAKCAKRPAGKKPQRASTDKNTRRHTLRKVSGRKSTRLPAPATSGGLIVGLNADAAGWGGASTAGRLQSVTSATGTKWLRENFFWSKIEPQPGVFDFSYYDHFMLLAAQRGLHVLPLLYYTPTWAGANYNAIPSDPAAFAQYVAAVVGRYGTHGSFWAENPTLKGSAIGTWELWNEPYLGSGDDGDYDPGAYARLVKAAAVAGRSVDPDAKFLMAAEMQSARDANGNWQWWVDALYQAVPDLNNYFDGVAMHDYGNDVNTLSPMVPGRPYGNYGHIMRIEDLRQQFIDHNAANKPFWITEAGWPTCTDGSSGCVTDAQQAADLQTLFNHIRNQWGAWVQAAFIYRYGDGADPTTVQDAFGLTNLDGTPKPALAIFQQQVQAAAARKSG